MGIDVLLHTSARSRLPQESALWRLRAGRPACAARSVRRTLSGARGSQVTLIPRGQARGLTWFIPGEDPTLISKQQIFARIVGALGGRATEEVIFGDAEVTTGASSDLQMVRRLGHGWAYAGSCMPRQPGGCCVCRQLVQEAAGCGLARARGLCGVSKVDNLHEVMASFGSHIVAQVACR